MGLLTRGEQKIHFVHIPKTAGTSIVSLLKSEGWDHQLFDIPNSLRDQLKVKSHFTSHPHQACWSNLDNYKQDCEYEFSVVRHPYDRFASALNQTLIQLPADEFYQHISEIPHDQLMPFVESILFKIVKPREPHQGIGMDDNRWRPQVYFLSEKTEVFRYEDGLEFLIDTLKEKEYIGANAALPKENVNKFVESNSQDTNNSAIHSIIPWYEHEETFKIFASLYRHDFERLHYSL